MNFDELSNAFFRFPIRPIGAELAGGAFRRPPPVGRVSLRPTVGRGLITFHELSNAVFSSSLALLAMKIAGESDYFGKF